MFSRKAAQNGNLRGSEHHRTEVATVSAESDAIVENFRDELERQQIPLSFVRANFSDQQVANFLSRMETPLLIDLLMILYSAKN